MNPARRKILKILLIRRILKRLRKRPRRFSSRPLFLNRSKLGENTLVQELRKDPEYHKKYFRMSKESFDIILAKTKDDIQKKQTHSCPISPSERLAITLRYLAKGNSQVSIGINYRVSPAAVTVILRETMTSLCARLSQDHLPPPNVNTWLKSEQGFSSLWNFPNCCGSIDGKHIRIRCPSNLGSTNFNYKTFSQLCY